MHGGSHAPRLTAPGSRSLAHMPERRCTSRHYTPRSHGEPTVERAFAPFVRVMTHEDLCPNSERRQRLHPCDGARHARGPAKLSLWLVALTRSPPRTFLDHTLHCRHSLAGLDREQIVSFHWAPTAQVETCRVELEAVLQQAIDARQQILALAADESPAAQRAKEWLLRDAEDALDRVRLIGDVLVGAFFSAGKHKSREAERRRRMDLVTTILSESAGRERLHSELRMLQAEIRTRTPVFHWMVEYPEVFWLQRPDPLAEGAVGGKAWIDAFVGNPPFAGKNNVAEMGGPEYVDWLKVVPPGSHGNADYVAHFFRRAGALLGEHGTIGLIATNTISQGDTRATGLQAMLADGFTIYDATRSMPWPGDAAVAVAVVHLAKGTTEDTASVRLVEAMVTSVNSRLRAGREVPDPVPLQENANLCFVGSYVLGMGFVLTPDERDALVARDARNAERISPYLGGEEVNTSPTQAFDRYVDNFGDMSLADAEHWPDLIQIAREQVKPERDRLNDNADGRRRKQFWWQFGRETPGLASAIGTLPRCIVTAAVSKHLVFSFQPTDRTFSKNLFAFALPSHTSLGVLQSRVCASWTWLLSSTMKTDLSYSPTDCFATFPFPSPDPRTIHPDLESIGGELYETRARYMVDTDQGLTKTYNALKDPTHRDPRILHLRALHEALDRAVVLAYGWPDLATAIPPYCPLTPADTAALSTFTDTILDRLFALNRTRSRPD